MDGKYTIEEGKIILKLDAVDLESVLDDISGCRDLLEPQIKIEDNKVIFRDNDIKLVDPVSFFGKELPRFSVGKSFIRNWIITALTVIASFTLLGLHSPLLVACLLSIIGGVVSMMGCYIHYSFLEKEHINKHRKATYVRAKLLSYFYMIVMQELTTTSERLERTGHRLQRDIDEIKTSYREMHSHLPKDVIERLGNKFPDGDVIKTVKKVYN